MKISHNWLQTFFVTPLPPAPELEQLLTFHSSEIEEVLTVGNDTVLDVKVLPDKSAWLMSHRGVAKEISVITGAKLTHDVFLDKPELLPATNKIKVTLETPHCDYYAAALLHDVAVGPSPDWLALRLVAIGQRSINNIVDATNYVMFELGQPLHAFDADKLQTNDGHYNITVRQANEGEKITTLTGEGYTLNAGNMLITDGASSGPLAVAGIKGGMTALVDSNTKNIILESAHFDRFSVRSTSKQLKLRTDASARYENGITVGMVPLGLTAVVKLITEIAGGTLVGYTAAGTSNYPKTTVSVALTKINSTLGVLLSMAEIESIIKKFGYQYEIENEVITVTSPWERDDLVLAADLIEEIGRIYGMDKVASVPPPLATTTVFNARHFYAEKIRDVLVALGFSEIYTSSFRSSDVVHIQNALASDKSYLRSSLHANMCEAVAKNTAHRDLLGLPAIKLFEIGTTFTKEREAFRVALGVQTGTSYKAKVDDALLKEAQGALETALGHSIIWEGTEGGVTEFNLDSLLASLPVVTAYAPVNKPAAISYQPFSLYPSMTRDIALWVPVSVTTELVETLLKKSAGSLCVRATLFDTFIKEDKTSLAFRLVFQSKEKTLTAHEVDEQMNAVYNACRESGWETR